jgi:hypothetical protein
MVTFRDLQNAAYAITQIKKASVGVCTPQNLLA